MDELIMAVFRLLSAGASIDDIHQACLTKGWAEDTIFLAIKAGQNLYDALVKQEKELDNRPLPFGRKR